MQNSNDIIRQTLAVSVPVERAFEVFTDELESWWPQEYTWAGDVLETIVIEPKKGGRCFERGPHGFELDWGRVLACEAPHRLVFTWQISPGREPQPNPTKASEVEVRFQPEGQEKTRIEFEHRNLSNHGDGGEQYHSLLAAPQGWQYILRRYAEVVR